MTINDVKLKIRKIFTDNLENFDISRNGNETTFKLYNNTTGNSHVKIVLDEDTTSGYNVGYDIEFITDYASFCIKSETIDNIYCSAVKFSIVLILCHENDRKTKIFI